MKTVSAHSKHGQSPKGRIDHIHVEKMGNGVVIHKRTDSTPGQPSGANPPGMVFTKHAPAVKHFKQALSQMGLPPSGAEQADGDMEANEAGGEAMGGQAPVATNP